MSGSPVAHAAKPGEPDPRAILRTMVDAYHGLASMEEATETRVRVLGGREFLQTGTFRFQKPALISMTTVDPEAGTYTVQADGRTFVVYSGKTSVFARRTAPADLGEVVDGFRRVSREDMGIQNTQILSPLSLILAKSFPTEIKNMRYGGLEVYDQSRGSKAHHLIGSAAQRIIEDVVGGPNRVKPIRQRLDIWIDVKSHLAVRVRGDLAWLQPVKDGGQVREIERGFTWDEVKRSMRTNIAYKNDDFRFVPPRGSVQKFQTHK